MKEKLLQIFNEIKPSGAETMLWSASTHLSNRDFCIHALSTGKIKGSYSQTLEEVGIKTYHIPFKRYGFITSPFFLIKLFFHLKKQKYNVIHIHPERGYFGYAILAYLSGCRRIVRTVHHIFPQNTLTLKGLLLKPIKTLQRKILRSWFGVKFTSNSISGKSNELYTYKSDNIYLPNWYDERTFNLNVRRNKNEIKKSLKIPDSHRILLSLGGNWEYKNYELILETIGVFENKITYLNIGPDPNNTLKKIINEKKIQNAICLGSVDDITEYLAIADCYIMPSTIEGFGVAAVEAMACGIPCILSNRPALIDFSSLTDSIIYIEPTIDGIKKGIDKYFSLTNNDIQRIEYELSSLAIKNFSSKLVVHDLMKIYEV